MAEQAGRRAVMITGASYGVGQATALAFARAGYDVAVTATRAGNLDATIAALAGTGVRAAPVVLDLASQASIEQAMVDALAALGRLDVLVNNAGVHGRTPAVDITREEWAGVFSTNLDGTFFLTQQLARHVIAAGRPASVVNITSTHAIVGIANRLMYGTSKAAVQHLTRMLAIEWADHGIRVNAIAPGRMMTPSPNREETAADTEYVASMIKRIPLHRMASAEDVAAAALFLAGDQAGVITGHILVIDGGLTVV